jgi:hypothetical protein
MISEDAYHYSNEDEGAAVIWPRDRSQTFRLANEAEDRMIAFLDSPLRRVSRTGDIPEHRVDRKRR